MTTNIFQKLISYSNVKALVILAIIAVTLTACSDDTATEEKMIEETSTAPQAEQIQEESKTIVEIAVEDGRFTTLVTALQAAGLDSEAIEQKAMEALKSNIVIPKVKKFN